MLVHGFPQHWWEWRELIGPLAADGYRVLCPDLRGAGWSSAPAGAYRKNDMADDLAAVLDRLHVGPVTLVAHDCGGFVAFIMMLRHPAKVTGFFGLNTGEPWLRLDRPLIRHLWRFWYQIPLAFPVVGPRIIADSRASYLRLVMKWVGAGYMVPENDFRLYASVLHDREHAVACSRWYRTFLSREFLRWLRGEFADEHVKVPVRWLHGTADPVLTPPLGLTHGNCPRNALGASLKNARETVIVVRHGEWAVDVVSCRDHQQVRQGVCAGREEGQGQGPRLGGGGDWVVARQCPAQAYRSGDAAAGVGSQ